MFKVKRITVPVQEEAKRSQSFGPQSLASSGYSSHPPCRPALAALHLLLFNLLLCLKPEANLFADIPRLLSLTTDHFLWQGKELNSNFTTKERSLFGPQGNICNILLYLEGGDAWIVFSNLIETYNWNFILGRNTVNFAQAKPHTVLPSNGCLYWSQLSTLTAITCTTATYHYEDNTTHKYLDSEGNRNWF